MIKFRSLATLGMLCCVGLAGFLGYRYFFDNTVPELYIAGLSDDRSYSGDVPCVLTSTKNGEVSIFLDGQVLVNKYKMKTSEQGYPFTIPTKTIANGGHRLKVDFIDSTFHKNKAGFEQSFQVDNVPLQAAFLKSEADYKVFQGRTLHVQFQVNKPIKEATVTLLSQTFNCFPEAKNSLVYECFVPIGCEESPNEYLVSADVIDYVGNQLHLDNKFQVVVFPFKKQTIQVSAEKVKEEDELGLEKKKFEQEIEQLTANSIQEKLWKGTFCPPIEIQRVSCDFGTIRTTQHKGRYAHKALDVVNLPKSVVWATQDGIVVMKDRFAESGNTVIIDHGMGVLSLFFHLDNFAKIEVGDKVAKGNPIGTIGKTGYAAGYHLHWEMRINNVAVDPMQWTKQVF